MSAVGDPARRLVVVGASSGIGRALAYRAAHAGWHVLAAARRHDRLTELQRVSGTSLTVLTADIRSDHDCQSIVDTAVTRMGGIDALVYATGTSPLSLLTATDGDAWREVLETNVVGAALVCRAALPHLRATNGKAVFVSSVATDDPRPYLVAYGASKAALDAMIRGWRNEFPDMCFVRAVVGPTATDFGSGWDPDIIAELNRIREARGLTRAVMMTPDEVADELLRVLESPVWAQDITLMPRNWS